MLFADANGFEHDFSLNYFLLRFLICWSLFWLLFGVWTVAHHWDKEN